MKTKIYVNYGSHHTDGTVFDPPQFIEKDLKRCKIDKFCANNEQWFVRKNILFWINGDIAYKAPTENWVKSIADWQKIINKATSAEINEFKNTILNRIKQFGVYEESEFWNKAF